MNVVSTHFVNPSITAFIESQLEKVAIDPCSTRVSMKEPAFRANSRRASSTPYIFFGSIALEFDMWDVWALKLTSTTCAIFSTTPTRLWRPGTGARLTICWLILRAAIVPWSTACVLSECSLPSSLFLLSLQIWHIKFWSSFSEILMHGRWCHSEQDEHLIVEWIHYLQKKLVHRVGHGPSGECHFSYLVLLILHKISKSL